VKLKDFTRLRIDEIHERSIVGEQRLDGWEMRRAMHVAPEQYEYLDQDWQTLNEGDIWARQGQTSFLKRTITVPKDWAGYRIGLKLMTDGEGLLNIDGQPFHGVDDNRVYILLTSKAEGGETYPCLVEMKTGNYFEYVVKRDGKPYILSEARLVAIDKRVEDVYYDFMVAWESATAQHDSVLKEGMLLATRESLLQVDFRDKSRPEFVDELQAAAKTLKEKLSSINYGDCAGKIFYAGHSHIDVAWLWPLKETARKVGRSYSTVAALMDEYPDYHFVCSQVPLFLYLKDHFPSVYEKIKKYAKEGRFEPIGGTWVENDCNVVSGESFVRQCLYGKRFFKDEFGVDVRVGWLPDVFGDSWAMPQIYKKSGIEYYMTSKLTWNEDNRFPYNTFWWQGVDGTRILTHCIHGSYNAIVTAEEAVKFWDDYHGKFDNPEMLCSFGWGDGGGSPDRKMLEYIPRLADMPGMPKARTGRTHDYFDNVAKEVGDLPVWNDELYFEQHRGTFTTHAANKRSNRKSELLYRDAEMYGAINTLFGGSYPKAGLYENWTLILLNQFHDIIPGSSITMVYDYSKEDYRKILGVGEELRATALSGIAENADTEGQGTPVIVFNSLSWPRSGVVTVEAKGGRAIGPDGAEVAAQVSDGEITFTAKNVPSCGFAVYHVVEGQSEVQSPFKAEGEKISTPFYELTLAADGTIRRLYDKTAGREVLPNGARANVLQVFEDKPATCEAWDIDITYQDRVWELDAKDAPKVVENGPVRLVLSLSLAYGKSTVDQKIVFYADDPRIDFVTKVDWKERKTLLKAAFPVEVLSPRATYEIAFGAIERPTHWNTSWDSTKFEVSGHKWADLSEAGYGVSILNDCKYGWDIKDSLMRLTLLRAPESPDPVADLGRHEFTYSLLPHAGDWRNGTVRAGFELNVPLTSLSTDSHSGALGREHSFFGVDNANVIIDTIKQAEDGDDLIVRVYEAHGSRGPAKLSFDRAIASAAECNLLEEGDSEADFSGSEIRFTIKPFEVRTFKVRLL
jgi:alpha-mannosidase